MSREKKKKKNLQNFQHHGQLSAWALKGQHEISHFLYDIDFFDEVRTKAVFKLRRCWKSKLRQRSKKETLRSESGMKDLWSWKSENGYQMNNKPVKVQEETWLITLTRKKSNQSENSAWEMVLML